MTDAELLHAARDRGWWLDKATVDGMSVWVFDGFDEALCWPTRDAAVAFMRERLAPSLS